MVIRGCKTIDEYCKVREERVRLWFFLTFDPGFFSYRIDGNSVIVTDSSGAFLKFDLGEIV